MRKEERTRTIWKIKDRARNDLPEEKDPKDQKTDEEDDDKKLKTTKPRKYKGTTYNIIKLDDPKPET